MPKNIIGRIQNVSKSFWKSLKRLGSHLYSKISYMRLILNFLGNFILSFLSFGRRRAYIIHSWETIFSANNRWRLLAWWRVSLILNESILLIRVWAFRSGRIPIIRNVISKVLRILSRSTSLQIIFSRVEAETNFLFNHVIVSRALTSAYRPASWITSASYSKIVILVFEF